MVSAAVKVYGEGKQELSKEQFSLLLKDILTDIADRLEANPIVLASSTTVFNGSKLKKVWSCEFMTEEEVMRASELNGWSRAGSRTAAVLKALLCSPSPSFAASQQRTGLSRVPG